MTKLSTNQGLIKNGFAQKLSSEVAQLLNKKRLLKNLAEFME